MDATEMQTRLGARFYQACRETFTILYYPARKGLTPIDLDPKYVANEYKGEEQVLNALKECYKYTVEIAADSNFRRKVEDKLWPANTPEVAWTTVKQRAAADPSWVWHHPDALDNLKDELVKRDIWREMMGYINRGPFEKSKTSVHPQLLSRDENTGQVTLRLRPLHGDAIYMEIDGTATVSSKRMEDFDIKTKALRLSFLCVDSRGEHGTGDAIPWANTISIKHRFYQEGSQRKCELQAIPQGRIRYTTDGSSVESHGIAYGQPFTVPEGCRLILAVAEEKGIKSHPASIPAPEGKIDIAATIDRKKAAIWRKSLKRDSTGETYQLLEIAKKHGAELGGVRLAIAREARWVEMNTPDDAYHAIPQIERAADLLKEFIPEGILSIDISGLKFDSGQQLLDLVADLKTELREGEIIQ
jgi:hypothetical protein